MLSMTEAMAREEVKASEAAYAKSAEPFKYSKSPAALQESERRWETELATARAQQKTQEAGPCAIVPHAVEIAKPHKGQVEGPDRGPRRGGDMRHAVWRCKGFRLRCSNRIRITGTKEASCRTASRRARNSTAPTGMR